MPKKTDLEELYEKEFRKIIDEDQDEWKEYKEKINKSYQMLDQSMDEKQKKLFKQYLKDLQSMQKEREWINFFAGFRFGHLATEAEYTGELPGLVQ